MSPVHCTARTACRPRHTFQGLLNPWQGVRVLLCMQVEAPEVHAETQGTVLLPDQDDRITPWGLAQMNHSCFQHISGGRCAPPLGEAEVYAKTIL